MSEVSEVSRSTNLNLYLPTVDDPADISKLSWNFNTIDAALAAALPAVTSSDNGKFLMVVDGEWAAAEVSSANGVST